MSKHSESFIIFPLFISVRSDCSWFDICLSKEIQPSHLISFVCHLNKYQWGIQQNAVFTQTMRKILCASFILVLISSPPSSGCCDGFLLCQKELETFSLKVRLRFICLFIYFGASSWASEPVTLSPLSSMSGSSSVEGRRASLVEPRKLGILGHCIDLSD